MQFEVSVKAAAAVRGGTAALEQLISDALPLPSGYGEGFAPVEEEKKSGGWGLSLGGGSKPKPARFCAPLLSICMAQAVVQKKAMHGGKSASKAEKARAPNAGAGLDGSLEFEVIEQLPNKLWGGRKATLLRAWTPEDANAWVQDIAESAPLQFAPAGLALFKS